MRRVPGGATMSADTALNVFISYRRDDAIGSAGRLFDWLVRQFGRGRVFLDTDKIAAGEDFARALDDRLSRSDVVLVVIGPRWLDIANEAGRRLEQPDDYVRIEVATALASDTRVIPVLVGGAAMPSAERLPEALRGLARLNAASLRDAGFEQDFDLLVDDMLGRPRGYVRRELDRLQRLLKAIRLSSLLVPGLVVILLLALWTRALDFFTLDTRAASYLLWAADQVSPPPTDPGVLLVAIDEASEQALGREFGPSPAWRQDHARLIERAAAAGARAVVFDLFFERSGPADTGLAEAARRATRDGGTRVVFGVRALSDGQPRLITPLREAADWGSLCLSRRLGYTFAAPLAVADAELATGESVPAGVPALALAAVHAEPPVAIDPARRVIRLQGRPDARPPHFSIVERIRREDPRCATLRLGDEAAMLLIRVAPPAYWRDPQRRASYAAALDPATLPDARLRDRILLVGVTLARARDRYDLVSGLTHRSVHGVELHADAIANLATAREVVTPSVDAGAIVMLLLATGGAAAGFLLAPYARGRRSLALGGGALLYLLLAVVLAGRGLLLNVLYDLTAFALAYAVLRRFRAGGFERTKEERI